MTTVTKAALYGADHVPLSELLQNLRGTGRGIRFRGRASEVAQAYVLAELHREHLLDWRHVSDDIDARVGNAFA